MSRHPGLYQWIDTVVMRFSPLGKPQAVGLALWSFGMILARSCSLAAVAGLLAPLTGRSFNSMRERLRDTYREAGAKSGGRRAGLDVTLCWAPWLAWVLDGWLGTQTGRCHRCDQFGRPFCRLGRQRRLSRLCRAGRLESLEGRREACLETGMAGVAGTVPRSSARRLDGACAGGPWLVCEVAVRSHRRAGVASVPARQRAGPVPPRGLVPLEAAFQFCAVQGQSLAGAGNGVQRQEVAIGLHVAGLLGRGA